MSDQLRTIHEQTDDTRDNELASLPDLHDRITEAYFGKMGDEFARSTRERVHWVCSNVNGQRVLDVGCSQGIAALLLGREGKTVVGIDVAKRSIEEAREYLARETIRVQEQVSFVQRDFLTADLRTECFDTVIMAEVLEHLTRPEAFILAAAQCLRENGRLIVTVPFGVNDWPDHKKTFYFSEPWRLIIKKFNIDEVKFFGKWIGFVATLRSDEETLTSVPSLEDGLAQTEAAFQEIERHLLKRVNTLAKEASEIRAKLRVSDEQNASMKKTAAESEAARAGLAQAFVELKEHSQRTEDTLEALRTEMQAIQTRLLAEKADHSTRNARLELQLEEQKNKIASLNEDIRDSKAGYDALQVKILDLQSVVSEKDKEVARLTAKLSASDRWSKLYQVEAQEKALALEAERTAHLESQKQRLLTEYRAEEMASRLVNYETELEHAKQNLRERTEEVAFLQSRLEQLRAEQEDKEKELTRLSEEIDASKARELALTEETEALRGLVEKESRAAETQEEKRIEADARASALNDHLAAKQAELSALRSAFEQQDAELNEQKERFFRDLITAEETALLWLEELERQSSALKEAQKQITALEEALDTREEEHRAEKQDLFDKLEASRNDAATLQTMIDTAEQEKRRLAAHAAAMKKTKILANERADRQRKTLSFRLGNTLIFGFKSWKGFLNLPADLIRINLEWARSKKKENSPKSEFVGELNFPDSFTIEKVIPAAGAKQNAQILGTSLQGSTKLPVESQDAAASEKTLDVSFRNNPRRYSEEKKILLSRDVTWQRFDLDGDSFIRILGNISIKNGGDKAGVLLVDLYDKDGKKISPDKVRLPKSEIFGSCFVYLHDTKEKKAQLAFIDAAKNAAYADVGFTLFQTTDNVNIEVSQLEVKATRFAPQSVTTSHNAEKPKQAFDYKVAIIADEFTTNSFSGEFQALPLDPDNWLDVFQDQQPDIFFCESAWAGPDPVKRLWRGRIYASINFLKENRKTLLSILEYCKKAGIPTVFWNKEDPTHHNDRVHDFVQTASLFDYVFTTAEECVESYKINYGVKNVFTLPFGTNPKLFNPIENGKRGNKVVFAGSWYENHTERCKEMRSILDRLIDGGFKLDIYNRYHSDPDPQHIWPEKYSQYLLPGRPHHEMPEVYKSSVYGLNINTVTASSTMFARRVFELMSSNTLVVSNYSKGVDEMFGDLVVFPDRDPERLKSLTQDEVDNIRNEALHEVLEKHTFKQRWRSILQAVGLPFVKNDTTLTFTYVVKKREEALSANSWYQQYRTQFSGSRLLLVVDISMAPLEVAKFYREFNRFGVSVTSMLHAKKYALPDNYRPVETSHFVVLRPGENADAGRIKKGALHLQYMTENLVALAERPDQRYKTASATADAIVMGEASQFLGWIQSQMKKSLATVYWV